MSTDFVLEAELRTDKGKGASRRLRRKNRVPAILYGGDQEALSIELQHNTLALQLKNEAFYSHILTLKLPGKKEQQAILKDVQRHPYKPQLLHLDFLRVSQDKEIHVHVPLHFINEEKCVGVKLGGGIVSKTLTEVDVVCLPKDLPEYIEVDIENLAVGASIHLSELVMPKGARVLALVHDAGHDTAVVSVYKPRSAVEETVTSATTEAAQESKTEG